MQKHRQRHNWPKLGIKCLNSINILNENWSSQSLILGQFSASMTEPHFRININIYNDVNINVNVKITIAHQVGIILQPLGSDHSSLNNTIEFRTSHSNQLVFIALFLPKENIQWKTEIAKLHRHSKSIKCLFKAVLLIKWSEPYFYCTLKPGRLKYIYFFKIYWPSFYCNFK